MATFKDLKGTEWKIRLNGPLVEDVAEKHEVNLADLDKDPLAKLRNSPMKLVGVIYLLCEDAIKEADLSPKEFGSRLPSTDDMLAAVRDSIIDFFPSGRASHVREVLTKYEEMAAKTDEIAVAKMEKVLSDPETARIIQSEGDREYDRMLDEMFPNSAKRGG